MFEYLIDCERGEGVCSKNETGYGTPRGLIDSLGFSKYRIGDLFEYGTPTPSQPTQILFFDLFRVFRYCVTCFIITLSPSHTVHSLHCSEVTTRELCIRATDPSCRE